jgi:D-alanyl-D-alanine carboxypeptidase
VPAPWTVSDTADGAIVSDVLDMAAYARLLLGRGSAPDGTVVLSEDAFAAFVEPRIDEPVEEREVPGRYAYGLAVSTRAGRSILTHSGGMVGYTALLMVAPEDGLGCVMLLNGHGDRLGTVGYALDAVGAAIRGEALPEVTHPDDPAKIEDATDYAGTYRDGDREVRIEARGGGLVFADGDVEAVLEREPLIDGRYHDRFLVAHDDLDSYPLVFERGADGGVVAATHGPTLLTRDGVEAASPPPDDAGRFEGLYRSNDPWEPVIRVYPRNGRMFVSLWNGEEEWDLSELEGGWYAAGDPSMPRRLRFLGDADGRALVLEFNGGRWYRSNEE